MSQTNYPTLNYTNQQAPSQQLFDNRNSNLKFIPIIIPTEGQNQYQQQYSSQQQYCHNQVEPNLQYSNIQVNEQLILPTPNLIKDKDFQQQKQFLFQIMGIFIIWTILAAFLYYILMFSVFSLLRISGIYLVVAIASLIGIGFLIKFGIDQKQRKSQSILLVLLGLILCYTLFYIGLLYFLLISVHNYWTSVLVYSVFQCMICCNFITNFIILIYLLFENTKIKVIYVCLIEFAIIAMMGIIYLPFFYLLIVVIPYPICILNAFKQILKGRFNLQQDEIQKFLNYYYTIVAASIAAFYGMFVICED